MSLKWGLFGEGDSELEAFRYRKLTIYCATASSQVKYLLYISSRCLVKVQEFGVR